MTTSPMPGNVHRAKTSPESTDGSFAPRTQSAPGPAAALNGPQLFVATPGHAEPVVCEAGTSGNHTRCPLGGPCTPIVQTLVVPGLAERNLDEVKMVLPAGMSADFTPEQIYAYDIETMNDAERGYNGLNPQASYITEMVVATDPSIAGGGEVFSGTEAKILADFTRFTKSLPPGLMVDWNGTFFDGPFLDHRMRQHTGQLDAPTWIQVPRPDIAPKYDALPTSVTPASPTGGWSTLFEAAGQQRHGALDVSHAFKSTAERLGVKWGLKPLCAGLGHDMYEIDRERLHEYTEDERRAYVLSDGTGTRFLALKTLGLT